MEPDAVRPFVISVPQVLQIHFVHARSQHPQARPLLLTHGWPGSVLEFAKIMAPLADPFAHGGGDGQ